MLYWILCLHLNLIFVSIFWNCMLYIVYHFFLLYFFFRFWIKIGKRIIIHLFFHSIFIIFFLFYTLRILRLFNVSVSRSISIAEPAPIVIVLWILILLICILIILKVCKVSPVVTTSFCADFVCFAFGFVTEIPEIIVFYCYFLWIVACICYHCFRSISLF